MRIEKRAGGPVADRDLTGVLTGGQTTEGSPPGHDRPAERHGASGGPPVVPAGRRGSDAVQDRGALPVQAAGAATDPWPGWARPQLLAAAALTERVQGSGRSLATELFRGWYSPAIGDGLDLSRPWRPLAGTYRTAHAGSGARILADGIALVDRHDAVGRDGWWRTWGDAWTPTHSRRHSVRILFSPRPAALAEFVATVTGALLGAPEPWLLACTTDPQRLTRSGSAVLYVPDAGVLSATLLGRLGGLLRPATPPLCLPLTPGAALTEYEENAMTFGEHRCHLVALAMQRPGAHGSPLGAIADVFASHGIDPGQPYRSR